MNIKILNSNTNINFINNKFDDKKILVLSLINNCTNSIFYIDRFIKNLNQNFKNTKFCFFTNNNIDNSNFYLKELENKYNNQVKIIYYPNESITLYNRIEKLAEYRNINFIEALYHFGSDFDYIIMFDSDLSDDIPVDEIVNSLRIKDTEWSCISGNHCYALSEYYYDELALRFIDDPIDITEKNTKFNEYYGVSEHWLDNLYIINGWLKVKYAFGGISIYHMKEILDIYNQTGELFDISNLPKFTAEHIGLQKKLTKNILINPNIKYNNSTNIEGKMYYAPIAFVPRDAGFFSVFNFLIGCLTMGLRVYPYFNKQEFLRMNNNINEHFCYWTESENCWFDYFEPIEFMANDKTHLTDEYKKFQKHRGESGPTEFRIPKDTHALIQDQTRFKEWRKNTHSFYKKYIKIKPEILDIVNRFWNSNMSSSKIIGVHYRHPSHFIESGKIYLEQYFEKIDKILSQQPDAQIFLATDSNFGIYAFMEKYKNKIKYIENIDRISMPEFLQWCFSLAEGQADNVGFINGQGFELHHKRIGSTDNKKMTIDLLTEVLCLAKCDYLIHTTSNVALSISYINPELELISL